MRIVPAALVLSVGLSLQACAPLMKTPYRTPDLSVPQGWQYGMAHANASTEVTQRPGRWWTNFNDPALERLVEEALRRNSDLAMAAITVRRAQLQAGLTDRNALPSLTASLGKNASRNASGDEPSSRSYSISGTAGYEVDLWGKLARQREAAQWSLQATEEDRKSAALSLTGTTMTLYWRLAYLNQRTASSGQSIAHAQKALDIAQVKYRAGAVALLDVIQAEQALAAQRAEAAQLVHQQIEARNAFALLFDGPPGKLFSELPQVPDGPYPAIDPGLPAQLLARRPDLQAAELRLRELLAAADANRVNFYPSLSLTGSLGSSSAALVNLLRSPAVSLGAGIALPFIQWQEMQLNLRLSEADQERAVIQFRQAFYRALGDVENALSMRAQQAVQAEYLAEALAAARKAERIAEVQYRAGSMPIKSWLDAQESRRAAEVALAGNRLERLTGYVNLYLALGGDASLPTPVSANP